MEKRGFNKETLPPAPPFVEVVLDKPRRLRFDAFAGERFETLRGHRMTLLAVVLALEVDPKDLENPLDPMAQLNGKRRLEFMSQYTILCDVLAAGLLHEEEMDRRRVMSILNTYETNGGDILGELWPAISQALQNSRMIQCLLKQASNINDEIERRMRGDGDNEGNPDGRDVELSPGASLSQNGAIATG